MFICPRVLLILMETFIIGIDSITIEATFQMHYPFDSSVASSNDSGFPFSTHSNPAFTTQSNANTHKTTASFFPIHCYWSCPYGYALVITYTRTHMYTVAPRCFRDIQHKSPFQYKGLLRGSGISSYSVSLTNTPLFPPSSPNRNAESEYPRIVYG